MSETKTMYDASSIRLYAATPDEALKDFSEHASGDLAKLIVNDRLNRFIAENDGAIEYQGWYWRPVDFFNPRGVTIARGGGRVAVCQNNKWDYAERYLTEEEQAEFLRLVWDAWLEDRKGGILSEIREKTRTALGKAGAFIESLSVTS